MPEAPPKTRFIETASLDARRNYALMIGSVVPRPIAWITSMSASGRVNAAPFSSYNYLCIDPPMVGVGCGRREGDLKDTARNVRETGCFVVNVVTEAVIDPMHQSSAIYPAEISEIEHLGIELAPSRLVKTPRIAASPISMECKLDRIVELGRKQEELIIGEVVAFHIAEDIYSDGRINIHRFHPLARLGGPNYARLGDIITMPAAKL